MSRERAREVIEKLMNSGILSDEIAGELEEISQAICEDSWEPCDPDSILCSGCPHARENDDMAY